MKVEEKMKIDLHVHSKEISTCGTLSIDEIIKLYTAAGYDAIVLTNHYNTYTANALKEERGIEDFGEAYVKCLADAASRGKEQGLLILPGCELKFDGTTSDYLVFGMTEEHYRNYREICAMSPKQFSAFAAEEGLLFYQAHPFRNDIKITDPNLLFGIEVQNTHPRHDSRNDIAMAWAEKFNLHKIAGSDCHQLEDVGTSAIITDYKVETPADLMHILKNDLYEIV